MALFAKHNATKICTTLCLFALFGGTIAGAAMDPRFELDPTVLSGQVKPAKPKKKIEKTLKNRSSEGTINPNSGKQAVDIYTVKAGDSLFKIMMRDYRLSRDEARYSIEEIKRYNNIHDVDLIKAGQKIAIIALRRTADGSLKPAQPGVSGAAGMPSHSFSIESPVTALSDQEVVERIRGTWDKIVPTGPDTPESKQLLLQTSTFSLTLDAGRYPTFNAMDGGRLLLDRDGAIPPLVKSLMNEKDPSLRIVSDIQSGTKSFISSLLKAAGFYSVEENFSLDFGVDPKLSFRSDFKIGKTPESLVKRDIVLLNSGLSATPPALIEFLKKEGYSLYEPFAAPRKNALSNSRTIHSITAKKQPDMLDAILTAISITPDRDRRLDVFEADNNGISLTVKAERYFERGGQRFVITSFDGDPVNYTLFRILETKGYEVIILEAKDDFRKLSEKILFRTKVKGTFAKHNILQEGTANYAVQMSGFSFDGSDLPGGTAFMTDIEIDPIISDLLTVNGYSIK